ncbi:MAG: dissimilatory-type sulfite reductase subunit alpha [Candidatus Nitricoxidivorans perseverans]|uniref:Dissimilatory-type sulfite reductase subunit alpha n=1 Tax=Candidatus Nitricoxidivorans perseverans TaxID=2975601 RepID=A0AA49IZH6_9PROT|nr:MAG: dissimilatory-type sulfite reductase subunit alpha [Candidatus Nitricoxidivorans perseverans]
MAKPMHPTPLLDELEKGPWPSFVTGLKRLAKDNDMAVDLLGQLEHSYETRMGHWKGGTLGVVGYGGGIIPRFSEIKNPDGSYKFPDAGEFHTLRIMPAAGMHYDTGTLRQMCDIWQEHGSGLIALHGQSGDIMFQGASNENVQKAFDAFNEMGFDLGGAGPALRTSASCIGAARCEQSCFDEAKAHHLVINKFLDDLHRPALPYKFKFKFSGCPNDCTNSIQRSDFATIGTWRDNIQTDDALGKKWFAKHGMNELVNDVIGMCPTRALQIKATKDVRKSAEISSVALDEAQSLEVDNKSCVRCMHCINVMTGALAPGKDRGVCILIGGKSVLKIGATMGSLIVPFMRLKTDEDWENYLDLGQRVIDFFAENALEHERTGEMIERIGLANFLEGIEVEIDPNMINRPRMNPYANMAGWDEEVAKAEARKAAA